MSLSSNTLLLSLSPSDFDLLAPRLEAVTLGVRKMLEKPNQKIEDVYFPETGFASVVAVQRNGKEVEVGLIGREGMTGLPSCSATTALRMPPISRRPERVTPSPRESCARRCRIAGPFAIPC